MNKDSLFNDALIESYIEWKADAIIAKKLKKVVIEKIEIPPIGEIDLTGEHPKFKPLLISLSAGLNVALVWPAGTGKTTAARQVAIKLWKEFYSISVGQQTGKHEFFGYQDAHGNYVTTLFRKAYEEGGIFLIDEFDAGNSNVLTSVNQALSNGHCPFPNGMVEKHKDFICIVAGNTYGLGGNGIYSGRNVIDGATLDRFVFIMWEQDPNLEEELSLGNAHWLKIVREARNNAEKNDIQTIIGNRTIKHGSILLGMWVPVDDVIQMTLIKWLAEDEAKSIMKWITTAIPKVSKAVSEWTTWTTEATVEKSDFPF